MGRDEELQRALGKLRAGNHCSIVGPPGSGKTALLHAVMRRLPPQMGWCPHDVLGMRFRAILDLDDVQDELVMHLGGQRPNELRRLMRRDPLRLLALDDLGGMDPGEAGYGIRRWLRGFAEQYGVKLLIASNEWLDVLFRHDDPTRDSPFETLDCLPVLLEPLPPPACRALIAQRLAGSAVAADSFADLLRAPWQPLDLLDACAQRYEELKRG